MGSTTGAAAFRKPISTAAMATARLKKEGMTPWEARFCMNLTTFLEASRWAFRMLLAPRDLVMPSRMSRRSRSSGEKAPRKALTSWGSPSVTWW